MLNAEITEGMDPVRARRQGLGLRGLVRELACPGYTLFTPSHGGRQTMLIDLEGRVVHEWRLPWAPGLSAQLTDHGTLLYCGRILESESEWLRVQPWKGGVVAELDWQGNVLWEVRHPTHHHDATLLRNGNVMLLCLQELPQAIAARVQGGRKGTEAEGRMWADVLVEMTRDGRIVWQWRSWEHLDPAIDRITAEQETRTEWTHGNAVVELDDGSLMVSFRTISTVAGIDRMTGQVRWRIGAPVLAQQHAPSMLPSGSVLVFDNGTHRSDHMMSFSRVIEVKPDTQQIEWCYQEHYPFDFFSPFMSSAQRLGNGNTLICEGNFGRIFEVTAKGQVVWEYVNPFFVPSALDAQEPPSNRMFRALRYGAAQVEPFLRANKPGEALSGGHEMLMGAAPHQSR